ncbi:MAG: hypothetical protein NC395_02835 [Prevotella sp.]|nr:hypothetical protein [Prevotella sp.]
MRDTAKFCPYCGKENVGNGSEFAGKFDSKDGFFIVKSQEIFSERKKNGTVRPRKPLKPRIAAAAASLCVIAVCAAAYIAVRLAAPAINYSNAEKLFAEGSHAEAEEVFAKLGDYKDSREYVLRCRYGVASGLMEDGLYPEAADAFTALDGYADSNLRAAECMLKLADDYADSGNLRSAASVYAAAGKPELARLAAKRRAAALAENGDYFAAAEVSEKYGDTEAALEYRYTGASKARNGGDLLTAAENFYYVGAYRDAPVQADKCAYEYCLSEYEKNGASDWIVRGFYFLGDYLDSREMFTETAYAYGKKCLEEENYPAAAAMFRNTGSYEDSQALLYETRYALGNSLAETDPASARSVFALLSTYLDSSEKKKAAAETLAAKEPADGEPYEAESWYADGYTSTEDYFTVVFAKSDVLHVSCTAGTDAISPPVTLTLTLRDSAGNEVSADCENVRNSGSFSGSFSLSSAAPGEAEIVISRKDSGSVLRTMPITIAD